jgi:hypothetical protein
MHRALLAAVLGLAAAPAAASAGGPWATVNVCDTAKHPDTIGVRASMPGYPRHARLAMRFRVQYRTESGDWADVAGADSGWRALGVARGDPVESGWSFTLAASAGPVTLRGVVRFRRRVRESAPRVTELPTTAGHRSSAGDDPPGYSAATCRLGS